MTDRNALSPLNPLPGSVWLLLIAVVGVELALLAGSAGLIGGPGAVGWRLDAVQRVAFSGTLLDWMVENRRFPPEHLLRLIAYPLVHASAMHTLFVAVFIAALGKFVGEGMRGWAVLVVFFGASIAGALIWASLLSGPSWLLGGYPGVFGLVGAFTYLLWIELGERGANRARAFILIGVLLLARLLVGLYVGLGSTWLADLAGFVSGFGLSFLVAPGGWRRALERIRHR